jgi:hypothetical protein
LPLRHISGSAASDVYVRDTDQLTASPLRRSTPQKPHHQPSTSVITHVSRGQLLTPSLLPSVPHEGTLHPAIGSRSSPHRGQSTSPSVARNSVSFLEPVDDLFISSGPHVENPLTDLSSHKNPNRSVPLSFRRQTASPSRGAIPVSYSAHNDASVSRSIFDDVAQESLHYTPLTALSPVNAHRRNSSPLSQLLW